MIFVNSLHYNPVPEDGGKPLWFWEWRESYLEARAMTGTEVSPLFELLTGVSYLDVSGLIQTSGCSKEPPYWMSDAMAGIKLKHGQLLVTPGDWVLELRPGVLVVVDDAMAKELADA